MKEYEWLITYSNGNGNGNGVYYTSHGLGPLFFSIFRKKQRDIKSLVYETRLFVFTKKDHVSNMTRLWYKKRKRKKKNKERKKKAEITMDICVCVVVYN